MARNRMIKKEFWTSEQIINLPIPARLLFIGMWNQADDSGILKNSALQLKAQIFPCDAEITLDKVKDYMNELLVQGLIVVNDTHELLRIKKWADHQKINRPTESKHNFIDGDNDYSLNTHGVINEDSLPKESKGKENKVKKKKVKVEDEGFDEFWDNYPRKDDKKKAFTAFKRLTKDNKAKCIEGVKVYVKSLTANGVSDRKLIKLPTTYINGENWNDELDSKPIEQQQDYRYDSTGNSVIGYCNKCGKSDFYRPDSVRMEDSRCCKTNIVPVKLKNSVSRPKQVVRHSSSSNYKQSNNKGAFKSLSTMIKEEYDEG